MNISTYYDLTPDVIEHFLDIQGMILEFGRDYYYIKHADYPDTVEISEINPREVVFEYSKQGYCFGYGNDNYYHTHTVPFNILKDIDWMDNLRQQMFEENIRAVEARKEEERVKAEDKRRDRRKIYEELKKEFG
jgi:hypothetical protein